MSYTYLLLLAPTVAGELTSTSVESRSLSVVWETVPCLHQGGPIAGYTLRYSNGTSIVNTTVEGSRQYVLTGLTPFTSYSVQVAAVNDGGTGPYSDPALTVETLQDGEDVHVIILFFHFTFVIHVLKFLVQLLI